MALRRPRQGGVIQRVPEAFAMIFHDILRSSPWKRPGGLYELDDSLASPPHLSAF